MTQIYPDFLKADGKIQKVMEDFFTGGTISLELP